MGTSADNSFHLAEARFKMGAVVALAKRGQMLPFDSWSLGQMAAKAES